MSPASASRPDWRRLGWLAGLPVLGLLCAVGAMVAGPHLADSLSRAGAGIARDTRETGGEAWLRLEAAGRDLVTLGEAPDAETRAAALGRLAALPGLRRLVDRTGVIEEASPFVWKAALTGAGAIALTGSRPAEIGASTFAEHLKQALPAGTRLQDQARAARGAPPDFLAAARFALERMRDLKPGAAATLTDTVLSFEGEPTSPAAQEAFRGALAALPHGYSFGTVSILPPTVADFRFAVERRGDSGLALSGHVVSDSARAEILAAARESAAGAAVEDRLQTARGLPSPIDAAAMARFAIRLSALMRDGSVRFDGSGLSVTGSALDAQAVGEIEAAMRDGRPAGVAAGPVVVTAGRVSPYRVRIERSADSVILSGHLPDAAARESLLAALRPRFFNESILDRSRLSDGAPENLVGALTAGIGSLSTLASGAVEISDREVRLSGESLYPQSAKALGETLPRALPRGWSASVAVEPREATERQDPATCTRLFAERVSGHRLRFAAGSTELQPEFYPVLDAVAALAKLCPLQRVEVVGHSDPAGAPAPAPAPPVIPEATSSLKDAKEPKEKAKKPGKAAPAKADAKAEPVKASASKPGASKPGAANTASAKDAAKDAAKPEAAVPSALPAPEPEPDLPQQRALAVVDYLRKAGVAIDRVVTGPAGAAQSDKQGVGFALRS